MGVALIGGMITAAIESLAATLSLRIEKPWPAVRHLPAMAGFSIVDPSLKAHGQTFYIPFPALTPAKLRDTVAEEIAKFEK